MVASGIARRLPGLAVAAAMVAAGCGKSDSQLPELPPPPVSVSQPVVREVVDHDDYEGRIAAVDTVDVRARVRGHLTKVKFKDGQIVKKGDLLFEIDPKLYKAEVDVAEAALKQAQA
ncbi:MAG: biotin/lipoyl-binding protein [Gemmataceae bacterium]|nr:biotin/lipoyl-binding protein [Gemmataceae bacterium]